MLNVNAAASPSRWWRRQSRCGGGMWERRGAHTGARRAGHRQRLTYSVLRIAYGPTHRTLGATFARIAYCVLRILFIGALTLLLCIAYCILRIAYCVLRTAYWRSFDPHCVLRELRFALKCAPTGTADYVLYRSTRPSRSGSCTSGPRVRACIGMVRSPKANFPMAACWPPGGLCAATTLRCCSLGPGTHGPE